MHHVLAAAFHVDADHRKAVVTLRQLAGLGLRAPAVQRGLDPERVQSIVDYQTRRLDAGRPPLFIGDLVVCAPWSDADDVHAPLWLVDGQHRHAAALRVAHRAPDAHVGLTLLRLSPDLTLAAVFELVNRAVPVPEYVIHTMVHAARRQLLDRFGDRLKAAFPDFLKTSATPRAPHINPHQLQDRLLQEVRANGAPLLDQFRDGDELFKFVMWVNARLAHADARVRDLAVDKAQKCGRPGAAPLFLRADEGCAWLRDGAVEAWRDACGCLDGDVRVGHAAPTPPAPAPASVCTKAVPKVLRDQVWLAAFGGQSAMGACACCRRAIHITDWEAGHVIARACGGRTVAQNLRPLCRACNRSMGARSMPEFVEEHFTLEAVEGLDDGKIDCPE